MFDYDYFKKNYKLVAVDLSKQKELDADPRAIQLIGFKYMLETNSTIYWVIEKSKETILEFYKGTVKVYEKYRELKKVKIGKGEDYTTGSLFDYDYFKKNYKLVAVDLSKQKELDADPRAIQLIGFKYMLETNSTIYWVIEKSKETILEFYKGTVKVY